MTLAARSLPVPLSPVSRTVDAGLVAILFEQGAHVPHWLALADDAIRLYGWA